MRKLTKFFKKLFRKHKHDYEMTFPNPDRPFDWVFVCKCGDRTYDIKLAYDRMK